MRRSTMKRVLGASTVMVLSLSACTSGGDPAAAPTGDPGGASNGSTVAQTGPLRVRLAAGQPVEAAPAPLAAASGEELPRERIAEILSRLPDFATDDQDRQAFNRPTASFPPPTVGTTEEVPFGGAEGGGEAPDDPGPLEVVRHQPDGDVDVAPFLSVTFNQDVIPVGTLEQLDATGAPVRVTPELPGRWRWIGTRTLRYEHSSRDIDRLPAATAYTVEVPAGTASVDGDELAEAYRWTFRTPAPTVTSFVPTGTSVPLEPVFVATFDQRVDPAAVLPTITLTADDEPRALRLATAAEVDADDAARQAWTQALEGRAVAFRAEQPLPPDARIEVAVGPGTPSAEGPRTTEQAQAFDARTYGAFRLTEDRCGHGDGCRPGNPFELSFSNPIDVATLDREAIRIDPELPDATISAGHEQLVIQGSTRANTSYRVTVPPDLADTFGQALGSEQTVTFEVGDPRPELRPFAGPLTTVDPLAGTPSVSVVSVGHAQLRVRLLEVTPDDWPTFASRYQAHAEDDVRDLPWPVVAERTVDTGAGPDGLPVETVVDLRDAVDGDHGHVVVVVEPTVVYPEDSEDYWHNRPTMTWAQVTSLGVDAFADHRRLVAWVTRLTDGTPVGQATVRAGSDLATTDRDGLATLPLTSAGHLVASVGGEDVILGSPWHGRWNDVPQRPDEIRWYLLDDRGLYRPGETLHLKGVVRRIRLDDAAAVVPIGGQPTVRFQATDPNGVAIGQGTAQVSGLGTFDLSLDVPEGANLGQAWLSLTLEGEPADVNGSETGHTFRIDEFRRPAFEVVAREESPGPHRVTEPATLAATASYFAGGPLAGAPLTWTVTHRETSYSPPNWPGFTFGEWVPWWTADVGRHGPPATGGWGMADEICCGPIPTEPERVERFDATTDAGGTHHLRVDLAGERPDQPVLVRANATVTDVDTQQLADTVDLLVHPARHYVGLRTDRTFVREGEQLDVDLIVTTIDGDTVAGREIEVTAARMEHRQEAGDDETGHTEVAVDEQSCTVTSADEPMTCSFTPDVSGRYRIEAVVRDDDGGHQRSQLTRWVSGSGAIPGRTVEGQTLTIVPDQRTYEVGDTAQLLVAAPFTSGHGLVTVTRGDIVSTETITLRDGSAVVDVPVTDDLVGGANVQITVDGATERRRDDGTSDPDLPPRPAYATGSIELPVPPLARTLSVSATPRDDAVTPGDTTTLDLEVTGPDGRPAGGAEVAVIVADEAVLSLIGRELTDPVEVFHTAIASNLRVDLVRGTIVLSRPDEIVSPEQSLDDALSRGSADGGVSFDAEAPVPAPASVPTAMLGYTEEQSAGSGAGGPRDADPILPRTNFDPLALFAPAAVTGDDGRATVEVTVPDNLTRYRVTAIAVHGADRFGATEASLVARLPLMVRPVAPRFLNFGDRFTFPVVLHNQTERDLEADVVLQGANLAVDGTGDNAGGWRVPVPAGERVEVRFPAAADAAGTARFRVAAVADQLADAATGDLPVYTPVTTEAFATYGVLEGTADGSATEAVSAHELLAPEGVVPQFGGLAVSTSTTSLATLTDAVLYLEQYEFDNADAYASRVLSIVALRDVLQAFDVLGDRAEVDATVRDDLEELVSLQRDDGGFGWWRRSGHTSPYVSVHAAHALIAARDAGYDVDAGAIQRSLEYLRAIETHLDDDWDHDPREVVIAYALHVRARAGERDVARAERLFRESDDLPLDALAWTWPLVDDPSIASTIDRTVQNRVTETAGAAVFATSYDEGAHLVLASSRRTDGLLLDALIRLRPDSDLVPKVVNGLLANQRKGHWSNVQENVFILLALKRYFDTYEATAPDLVARVWLGDDYVAEHAYAGRTIDGQRSQVPMSELVGGEDRRLVVQNDGTGRLYYRLGMTYAPDDLVLDARDEGFVVDRTYEAVDDPDDVRRDEDGTWRVQRGANVRVRLTMVADSARTNLALVDPLPAGLEAVNPEFATAPEIRPEEPEDEPTPWSWLWWRWYDHQNLRDDRAEAFSAYLPAGTYEYTYVARATTPGTFVTPPAKAEELYAPEVFGRSASDRVVVG